MIEKLSCCLAHPMTALRTLKDKLNEVITGHNALVKKVDNLPAGGGGGGGSNPPANMFIFTVDFNEAVPGDSPAENIMYFNLFTDMTYEYIAEAVLAGCWSFVDVLNPMGMDGFMRFALGLFTSESAVYSFSMVGLNMEVHFFPSSTETPPLFKITKTA